MLARAVFLDDVIMCVCVGGGGGGGGVAAIVPSVRVEPHIILGHI